MERRAQLLKRLKSGHPLLPNGFDRGLEADEIIGGFELNGIYYFVIKWKGKDLALAEPVPSEVVKTKVPLMVIKWYERRITVVRKPIES